MDHLNTFTPNTLSPKPSTLNPLNLKLLNPKLLNRRSSTQKSLDLKWAGGLPKGAALSLLRGFSFSGSGLRVEECGVYG